MSNVMTLLPSGDRMAVQFGDGCELVQRSVALQIRDSLEAQVAVQEALWAPRDQHWATAMNRAPVHTTVERVPPERIFVGLQPSLVESRFDQWPAIAVRCHDLTPRQAQPDQYDALTLDLVIEVMCKAGPFTDVLRDHAPEEAVDRQLQRMVAAVERCISADYSLGGLATVEGPVRRRTSLPFARKLERGAGPQTIFQGAALTYAVTTYAV